jgi:predicted HAD superfamily Cof-like phosphohydrolase
MKKQIEQVKEFHKAFDIPILNDPDFIPIERSIMRQRILEEEVRELQVAVLSEDMTEVADALVDAMYILIGTAHEYGLANILEEYFDEVHKSNMTKLDENGKPIYRKDGKVIKGPNFIVPDLKSIVERND